jgi:hypothetical protein
MKSTTRPWIKAAEKLLHTELRHQRVFTGEQLRGILDQHREELGIPTSATRQRFVDALEGGSALRRVDLLPKPWKKKDRRASYKPFVRYVRPGVTASQVALSIRPGSYFSHGTAAYLHKLTAKPSETIYVNKEQSPKPEYSTELTQEGIDRAFRNPARASNYIYTFDDERIAFISGKNTGDYEIITTEDESGFPIRFTSLERTLVDITVRPIYAGGVDSVLSSFRGARERVSVGKLVQVIKKLDHAYPYHQAVGFYMQQAGIPSHQLTGLKDLGLTFKFYLANEIKNPTLDPDWQLYVPKDLAATEKHGNRARRPR